MDFGPGEVFAVALRKESVDRNTGDSVLRIFTNGSLSARRAWIEISKISKLVFALKGRSPQGERG